MKERDDRRFERYPQDAEDRERFPLYLLSWNDAARPDMPVTRDTSNSRLPRTSRQVSKAYHVVSAMPDNPRDILRRAGVECPEVDDWSRFTDEYGEFFGRDYADAAILAIARLVVCAILRRP